MDLTPPADEATIADFFGTFDQRTSCYSCRLCKIPCSGHNVCEACRTRNADCACVMEAFSGGSQPTEPLTNHPRTEMFNGYASPGPSLSSTVDSPSAASGGMRFLYEELETVSLRLLCSGRTVVSADIEQSSYWHGAAIREPAHTGLKLPYRDVFAGLAQSIVELYLLRFRSLGCSPRKHTALAGLSSLFFQQQQQQQQQQPPSFRPRAPTIPPQSFTDLEVQQLIELWFAHHPLAFILSKSLLLHSYRNGTQDFELLALVLADASDFLGREDINTSQAMFEAVRARVLERHAISLSTMQALVLLGWHDFCLYQPRQGYIYLELARMIAAQRLNVSSQASPTAHHINGADIGDVEIDLTQRIYWFTTSFILWLSLHQSSPDLDILSALDVAPLPPNDPSFSAVYALDEGVGNIASLVAQKTAIRELWSLAHLTSTILPLFKLHLGGTTQSSPHKQSTPYWSPPLAPQALDHPIPSGQTARALLCAAFTRLPVQLDHSNPAQTFTHSALHLLAITSAFPSPQQQKQTDDRIVRAVPVAEVLRSIQAFLAATKTLARQAALQDLLDHDIRTAPWVVLGLDVCGRALVRVRRGLEHGQERAVGVVQEMARRLWEVCGERRLENETELRAVRERLGRLAGLVKEECCVGEEASVFPSSPPAQGLDGWVQGSAVQSWGEVGLSSHSSPVGSDGGPGNSASPGNESFFRGYSSGIF